MTIKLSKPFTFDHLTVLKGDFADVDDTWQWDPRVSLSPPAEQVLSVAGSAGAEKGRERGKRREKEKRGKEADTWAPLPRAIHISKTIFQNSQMAKYKRF